MSATLVNTNADHKYPGNSLTSATAFQVGDVMIVLSSNIGGVDATASWTGAGTGNFVKQDSVANVSGGTDLTILTATIGTAGTPVVTTSNDGDTGFSLIGIRGLSSATAHKSGHNSNSTANPLTVSLSPTVDCVLITGFANEIDGADPFTSFTVSQTTFKSDTSHYDASGYNLLMAAGGGPFACGANFSAGSANSVIVAIMLPIAASGTPALRSSLVMSQAIRRASFF